MHQLPGIIDILRFHVFIQYVQVERSSTIMCMRHHAVE